jgi:hypothetical protein
MEGKQLALSLLQHPLLFVIILLFLWDENNKQKVGCLPAGKANAIFVQFSGDHPFNFSI